MDRELGFSPASTPLADGSGERSKPGPPRQPICSTGSRYPAAGTQPLETSRRRRSAWRPRVRHPRPAPSPAAWVLATYWPGAGRSGGSASTGSSRASRGSRL